MLERPLCILAMAALLVFAWIHFSHIAQKLVVAFGGTEASPPLRCKDHDSRMEVARCVYV